MNLKPNLETGNMKPTLSRTADRTASHRRVSADRTPNTTPLHTTVRRAVRSGLVTRPLPCCAPPAQRLSILPLGRSAETAVDNLMNKVFFGLFAASGAIMGLTCYWNLQALFMKWSSFESAWASLLQG